MITLGLLMGCKNEITKFSQRKVTELTYYVDAVVVPAVFWSGTLLP